MTAGSAEGLGGCSRHNMLRGSCQVVSQLFPVVRWYHTSTGCALAAASYSLTLRVVLIAEAVGGLQRVVTHSSALQCMLCVGLYATGRTVWLLAPRESCIQQSVS